LVLLLAWLVEVVDKVLLKFLERVGLGIIFLNSVKCLTAVTDIGYTMTPGDTDK